MLNISDEVKNLFLQDSTKKKIEIEVEASDSSNPNELNFYSGTFEYQEYATTIAEGLSPITVEDFTDAVDMRLIQYVKYVRLGMGFRVHDITTAPSTLTFRCYVERTNGTTEYKDVDVTLNDYLNNFHYCPCAVFDAKNSNGYITQITDVQIINGDSTAFVGTITMWNYQVDMVNAVLDFPSTFNENFSKNVDDLSDYIPQPNIDNDNIEFESFSLTESLCSQDNIKFGLCESAHCEFTTVNYNYDLKDRTIRPGIRVQGYPGIDAIEKINFWKDKSGVMTKGSTYSKPGHTNTNGRLFTDHYLIYTDLPSDFFSRTNFIYVSYEAQLSNVSVISGTTPTYYRYGVICVFEDNTTTWWVENIYRNFLESGFTKFNINIPCVYTGKRIKEVQRLYVNFYDGNKTRLTSLDIDITYAVKEFQVQATNENDSDFAYNPNMTLVYDNTLDEYCAEAYSDPIPLGVFHVTDVKLEHKQNLIKQQVTAYDNIVKLEQNAANWYTQYMFTITTDDYQLRYDVEYARQIYSSFFNFMSTLGLESRSNHTETLLGTYTRSQIETSYLSSKRITWQTPVVQYTTCDRYVVYSSIPVNVNANKLYMVDAVNFYEHTDEEILSGSTVNDYASHIDSLKRGLVTNGGVIIEAYRSDNTLSDSFVVNRRDYFMLPEDSGYIKVICPVSIDTYYSSSSIETYPLIDSVSIYEADDIPELENGNKRLFYYNYSTREISDVGTSITGRDVVRSLLEICGCLFRLDRKNGLPEFVYCTKGGLYPRNDLFPADELYPRSGTDQLVPNGRYMSVMQDNYQVLNYGRIQVIATSDSNTTKSICQWEYSEDNDSDNTYQIIDNIFYSNQNMTFEYQYLYSLLQNMFGRISNMGYVPNVTQAIGMPWVECGDRVGIMTYTGGFESFVFRRIMKGVQLLIDTYESTGDEYTEPVKEFGYEVYN